MTRRALAYGEERLVGIGRALAIDPRYLLLDEPAAGLSPQEASRSAARIADIRQGYGCGILVIEHNMQLIMRLCDRVQVLARGKTISSALQRRCRRTRPYAQAYLGATGRPDRRARAAAAASTGRLSIRC